MGFMFGQVPGFETGGPGLAHHAVSHPYSVPDNSPLTI